MNKSKETVLQRTETVLSNPYVKNFEMFQDVFNTMSVEKASNTKNYKINETIESLLKQVRDTWGCKMCG